MNRNPTTSPPDPGLPTASHQAAATQQSPSPALSPTPVLVTSPTSANYRRADLLALKFYPPLLLFATATAAAFCFLYLTKPTTIQVHPMAAPPTGTDLLSGPQTEGSVPQNPQKPAGTDLLSGPQTAGSVPATASEEAALLPAPDHLPGDLPRSSGPATAPLVQPKPASAEVSAAGVTAANQPSPFVPTTLAIRQPVTLHPPLVDSPVTTTLEFPVYFRAGTLRWTPDQRARAEAMLVRLKTHQQECLRLRMESAELLEAWNEILSDSSPPIRPEPEPVQR